MGRKLKGWNGVANCGVRAAGESGALSLHSLWWDIRGDHGRRTKAPALCTFRSTVIRDLKPNREMTANCQSRAPLLTTLYSDTTGLPNSLCACSMATANEI